MTRKRFLSADIPKEFKLSAYDTCKSWGAKEWASALSGRCLIRRHWHFACLNGEDSNVNKYLLNMAEDRAKIIIENPLCYSANGLLFRKYTSPINDQTVAELFYGNELFSDNKYSEWAVRYINSMCYDFSMEEHGEDIVDFDFDIEMKSDFDNVHKTAAWKMHHEVSLHHEVPLMDEIFFISVDLAVPDDVLLRKLCITPWPLCLK